MGNTNTIFSAKEAKNNFGRLLDDARESPVSIEKHGRRVAVVVSSKDYDEFEKIRDAYWGEAAKRARSKGYLGLKKSNNFLSGILDASN
ncbi:MAG: prevent-host-death protein [Parcubacteria group bacterium CG11_big_fil_rev_8_21_14_0_20_39_22]|nr:MAG: prevent-host-death protein [Parcubacteria group bacterium CG11_big_fil_rev_8_21_14_0_20_39_22]